MDKILARRFAPFDFSVVSGFPNVVPTMDEWGDYFPIFRERKEDNPAQHLHEFHELMHQWEIHHEDVLLKMFMFSLAGDAREWYHSLPPASISSLREFHATFNRHCQKYYSSELICHNCCEEYRDDVQDIVHSCERCEDEGHPLEELMELIQSLSTSIEELKADFSRRSYEENAEDIPVLETDVLGSPAYDEEVMSDTDQEQTTFDGYPSEDDEEKSSSMVPVYSDCETDPGESHEGEKEEPHLSAILAQNFSPFNFSSISGYPHPVPAINEWDDYLPRFRGSKHDHPGEHLLKFHVCMLEHGFFHEDVWIKMFSFSLEEDALGWCLSLPAASIHSLKDFHDAFNSYYGKIYPAHLIFYDCCKRFSLHILQTIECSSCDESGEDLIERESKDESEYFANTDENFSLSISQEEVLPDMIDDSIDDGVTMDALFSTPSTPVVSDLKEEMVEEKNQDISLFSLQDKRVMRSPTPEEYSEEESIGCQSSYEREISYQEQHDREKEPSLDTHEETSCSQLADVFRADKEEKEQQKGQFISCPEPVSENHHLRSVNLHQPLIHLCLPEIFIHV
jgi:hypothetical protein